MTQLENMNDVQFLAKKNAEITRLKLIQAGLILVVIALASAIAVIAIASRFQEPKPSPNVDVITRKPVNGKDCSVLKFPKVVTAGEPFQYTTCGQKLIAVDATVLYQITCDVEGSQQLVPLGTAYSDFKTGEFEVTRTFSITSTRLQNSDKCYFESVPTYTLYQVDNSGAQRSFEVREPIKSTEFKLIVPEDQQAVTVTPTRSSTSQSPEGGQRQTIAANPTPSENGGDERSQATTSGGAGSDPNEGNGSNKNSQPIKLELDLPLLPPVAIGIGPNT